MNTLPNKGGFGLKPKHWADILSGQVTPAWVEIHAENYFDAAGRHAHALSAIANICPISIHGVGLSLGSAQGLSADHLEPLARLVERFQPAQVSEHLAWNAAGPYHLPDLLPITYDSVGLEITAENIARTQDRLRRTILIETPSRYDQGESDPLAEADFITALCAQTGCGILLDVNNIYLSAQNLRFDAAAYLAALPLDRIGEIHLAGHDRDLNVANLLIDTHRGPVCDDVWSLYQSALMRFGPKPTLIEWDTDPPSARILMDQAARADHFIDGCRLTHAA